MLIYPADPTVNNSTHANDSGAIADSPVRVLQEVERGFTVLCTETGSSKGSLISNALYVSVQYHKMLTKSKVVLVKDACGGGGVMTAHLDTYLADRRKKIRCYSHLANILLPYQEMS